MKIEQRRDKNVVSQSISRVYQCIYWFVRWRSKAASDVKIAGQQPSIEFATFYYDRGRNCRLSGRCLRAGVELSMRGSPPSGEGVSAARRYATVYTTLKPVVERNQKERRRLLIMRRRRKCEAIV